MYTTKILTEIHSLNTSYLFKDPIGMIINIKNMRNISYFNDFARVVCAKLIEFSHNC